MDLTEQVWQRDFRNASRAIPPHWLVRYEGSLYVAPEYRHRSLVERYRSLCCVGAARGWLR